MDVYDAVRSRLTVRQFKCSRALHQMELVAWAEGLGTCFVGPRLAEQNQDVKELLGISENMELITILPFGYRDERLRGAWTGRKPMSEIAHDDRSSQSYAED